jgi:two-component system chemotaxis sensor kinase CheA
MNLDAAIQVFFAECEELLTRMEEALLELETSSAPAETINEIFRAAHTIKGSAGLFGFDALVAFTHQVESLLDGMREGRIAPSPDKVELLLRSRDHILTLLRHAGEDAPLDQADVDTGEALIRELKRAQGIEASAPVVSTIRRPEAVDSAGLPDSGELAGSENWHISLRFGRDVLRNGMDPLSFLNYLQTLGSIVGLETLHGNLPVLDELDPESCYLGFEIEFKSEADRATIEAVFEFVRDDCIIHIIPPRSQISAYVDMIQALPEEELRLGEILVRIGALSRAELDLALQHQKDLQSTPPEGDMPTSAAKGALPLGEILTDSGVVAPVVVNAALEKQQKARDSRPPDASFLRVDAEKLDHLIELVGELVVANAGVQMLGQAEGAGPLAEAAEILARLVEEVRDVTLSLRMVQIGPTFQRFQRVVRDVSRELGKEIELVITGAETELDKTVVERIGDPLMHLVRNAMDHGIEPLDRRLAAGKPARAVLRLNAHHDAGSIVIEVSDDGGGLNRPKIRSKAIERGLIPPDAVLTDREIDQLIFMPGFSTADQVSNLSGRGVGMDVVRRDIEALRGSVEIDSTPGVGTTIRIRLPLTLAIIDGFLVGIGNSRYVLPVDLIVECVELPMSDRAAILERGYMDLRGEVLPIIWLRELLDLQHVPAARRENVLVLQFGRTRVGLVVDVLLGEHQTVIRPLGRLFAALKGVSGSTILGGGEVALILDVPGLVELGRLRERQGAAPAQRMNHEIAR